MQKIIIKIGDKLKTLRGSLSQQDIATGLGVTLGAYKMWETDKREPNLATLAQMVGYFHVSLDYLFGISDNASVSQSPLSESEYSSEVNRILSGISEIILDGSEDEELKQCVIDFGNALNIADASRLSKPDFISRVTGSTVDSRNGIDMPQTKKILDIKIIDFSRINSREKAIRDKMNSVSEVLQKRLRVRAGFAFGALVEYKLKDNEDD